MNETDYYKLLEVVSKMMPDLHLIDLQKEFFQYFLEVVKNAKGNRIEVIPGRCGLCKSTLLKAWIQILLENPYKGAIIVTNSIDRLEDFRYQDGENRSDAFEELYVRNMNKISLMTSSNKNTEEIAQKYKPILLMTSQRYFKLDKEQIKQYLSYEYEGQKCKRNIVVFDEEPEFFSFDYLGDSDLNNIDTALRNGITDLCDKDVKDWVLVQWKYFREYVQKQFRDFEYIRNRNTYKYWYDENRKCITEDDFRFFSIIEEYKTTMRKSVWNCMDSLDKCRTLVKKGAILSVTKAANKDQYCKNFMVIRNKMDNYLLGKNVKVIILDATAAISEKYNGFDKRIVVHTEECQKFNVRLDWMNIKLIDVNTSRNALMVKDGADRTKEIIMDYLKKQEVSKNDTLFATYKILHDRHDFEELGYKNCNYFGNMRGFNRYNQLHNYVQIGVNRQRDINYLAMLLNNQPEYINYALTYKNDIEKNIQFFDKLISSNEVTDIRNAEIAADTLQNIFRICARNLDNTDPVGIYLFFDSKQYTGLIDELEYSLGKFGAKIEVVKLVALAEDKIKRRKTANGEKSIAQKVLDWIKEQPQGTELTRKEILEGAEISGKQFEKSKANNKELRDMLNKMKIARGKYKKIDYPPIF